MSKKEIKKNLKKNLKGKKQRPHNFTAPWDKIREEFVLSPKNRMIQTELAKKYHVHYMTVRARMKKEGWEALRDKHYEDTIKEVSKQVARHQSYDAKKRIEVLENLLSNLVKDIEDGTVDAKSKEGIAKEVREIAKTLEVFGGGVSERVALTQEQIKEKDDMLNWLEKNHPEKFKRMSETFGYSYENE